MNWTVDMVWDDKITVMIFPGHRCIYALSSSPAAAISPSFIAISSRSAADTEGLLKNFPRDPAGVPGFFGFLVAFGS